MFNFYICIQRYSSRNSFWKNWKKHFAVVCSGYVSLLAYCSRASSPFSRSVSESCFRHSSQSHTAPTQDLETSANQIQVLVHTTYEDDSAVALSRICCHLKVSYIRGIKKSLDRNKVFTQCCKNCICRRQTP